MKVEPPTVKCYFISDLHIKDINERNGVLLLRFLNFVAEKFATDNFEVVKSANDAFEARKSVPDEFEAGNSLSDKFLTAKKEPDETYLFLLGDIFDLWISDHEIFATKYRPIVEVIARLKKSGVKIFYFEGNHDLHLEEYWTKVLGVEVFSEAQYFKLTNLTLRLEHGDLINQKDLAYLRLRKFVRSPFIEELGHRISGKVWNWLGTRLSKKSRSVSSKYRIERNQELVQMIRQHAKVAFDFRPFDLIISGHMHVFDDYDFQYKGARLRSINLGSWLESPNALELNNGQLIWHKGSDFLNWIAI